MYETICSQVIRDNNDIFHLFTDGDLIINLTQLFPAANNNITLGYYFADRQARIIAGKVIATPNNKQEQSSNWIKIAADDIPEEAVNLSFFVD